MNDSQVIVHDWQDQFLADRAPEYSADGKTPRAGSQASNAGFGDGITLMIGQTPATGIQYSEGRALTSATAYACTRARAETLASLPSIIYRQVSQTVRERARGSDPWRLLYDEPNPHMDPMSFYELMNMRMVNRGNAFAEIERDGADNPIALWPIHPSRVVPRSERDGTRWRLYWDVFTDVKDPVNNSYIAHRVEDRNMLNICGFGGNGIIAPGVIDMGKEEVSIDLASQQYGATFFRNGARPSGVVEHPGYIDDDDQRAEFRADMNRLHSGMENWHKIPIMWNGAHWKEMQANPEQAQFLETRAFSARQLCKMWNVPPAIVQIFDDYKFNTVDAMIMQFVLTAVRPDAVRVERAISRKVLSYRDERGRLRQAYGEEYFLEFLLEGLLRGDPKKQAETLELKRRNGIVNANEWRAVDNLNPIGPQGDKYILPGGFGDLASLGSVPSSKPASSNGGSDNASASESGPAFDRERLIEAVSRKIGPRRNQARGASLRKKPNPLSERNRLIKSMALNQLDEALNRINAVLESERERLAAKGQELAKANWDRHQARLESALLPGCKSYALRSQKIQAERMASWLAESITALQFDGQEVYLSSLVARAAKHSYSEEK